MAHNPSLSIVIPCYNEGENIPLIIKEFKKILSIKENIEIILVNNGSTDNSKQVFKNELEKEHNNNFKLVNIAENKGYGYGILTGLNQANGKVLSWTHADMQTDPSDVLRALTLYNRYGRKKIIIKGKRKNRKFVESFLTFGMQVTTYFILGIYLDDINAQPKLFSKKFFNQHIKNKAPNDFSLDLFLLYKAKIKKYKTLTIPVHFKKRIHGEAKGGSGSWSLRIKLIKRTFAYIIKLRKKYLTNN